jgi:2-C-methyl-D-erythritol 4-phosphate cytidylyltransferase / 2-C-methyl-D-erythritol 2,4-cyclodiphosphate synthase
MEEAVAILVGAGRGERLGAGVPKAFVPVAGLPLLAHAARAFAGAPGVTGLVAVVPAERSAEAQGLLAGSGKLRGVVAGGARRQDSVQAGLRLLGEGFTGVVLVHDAARPLVEVALVEAVIAAARRTGAAVPVLPVAETVKRVEAGRVRETVDRRDLGTAQTPQGFRYEVLRRAYDRAFADGVEVTDEAVAVERLGEAVEAVPGSPRNRKVTGPEDLAWAEWMLGGAGGSWRIGTGFDIHRLVQGRPLMLGGVKVEHDHGLEGHSDGDCVVHAVCDALLGACGAGDMGRHFPSHDPRWQGAPSLGFLEQVVDIVTGRGYDIGNVDVTVVAERPRLAPYAEAMRESLGRGLRRPIGAVSVKVKSSDGLGALGAAEGIAAHANVLIRERRA